jgi:hypothetical protein
MQSLIFIFLISVTYCFCQTTFFQLKKDIIEDLKIIQSIYPRNEGSANETKILEFIKNRLNELELEYIVHDFNHSGVNHSFSRSIEITISGEKKDTLIICAPINHPLESLNNMDGSINIALALSLVKYAKLTALPITLKILFLGAEYGEENYYPMGDHLFLNNFFPEYNVCVLYLNFRQIPKKIILKCGANGIVTPYWFINKCTDVMGVLNIAFLVKGNQNQAFRTGLSTEQTVISSYLNAGYPALSLEGEYDTLTMQEEENWILSFSVFNEQFIESFDKGIPERLDWDYHYLFFQLFDFYFILSEKNMVIITIIIISAMIVYAFFRIERIKKYFLTLKRNIWNLPIFFILVFTILLFSTLLLYLLLLIRSFPTIWKYIPVIFFVFKVTACLTLSTFMYLLLKRYKFAKNGSFYTISALLFLIMSVVVVALINISFTYYFLWALFFVFLFSITRKRILKILCILLSQIWIIVAVIDFFTLPELKICEEIVFSLGLGNLLFAIIIMPFILLLIRIRFLFRYSRRKLRPSISFILGINLALVMSVLAFYILLFNPYSSDNLQVIYTQRKIDVTNKINSLVLKSEAPLNRLEVYYKQQEYVIDTREREYTILLHEYPNLFSYNVQSIGFLNRKNMKILLQPQGDPLKIDVQVISEDEYVLYDANFPVFRHRSGKQYAIFIGNNPPNPLNLELTLPKNRKFKVLLSIEYKKLPFPLVIKGKNVTLQTTLILNESIDIST